MAGMGSFLTSQNIAGGALVVQSIGLFANIDYARRAAEIEQINASAVSKANNAKRLGLEAEAIDEAALALSEREVAVAQPGGVDTGVTPQLSALYRRVRETERLNAAAAAFDLQNLLAGASARSASGFAGVHNAGVQQVGSTLEYGRITGALGPTAGRNN